ncbi:MULTISPECIES: ArnT family glycosyltransferase [unclassified Haematospirillum]|uniref:ArnT family glycosyltransferase n=1 Tax=unclassified Haematospirillum TaxID=2622088 RepID=UPI001FD7D7A4|nr:MULTISPECIES: glycosyltransferase family 39 protein [unclassified Haematospirillum]
MVILTPDLFINEVSVQALLSGIRPWVILALLCCALYLPGMAMLPVMDRDEARFVQATRQMAESNDYIVVRFQDELRAKKPVGIYWLQAAAVSLFSHPADTAVWPYRVPSFLAALATVLLVFRFGSTLFDRRTGFVGALVMASSLLLFSESHLAKTDAVLLALTTAVMGGMGMVYMQSCGGKAAPSWVSPALWLAMGAAILVKGPVTPMIAILAVISLCLADRKASWLHGLRPVMGVVLSIAMVAPWMAAVSAETEGAFITRAIQEDLIPKLLGGQESHGAPPGYYLLLVGVTLWPGSLFLWPAVWRSWKERALPGLRFLLAWTIPAWLVLEMIPTKLPHYTLPLYPPLALMIATTVLAVRDSTRADLSRLSPMLWYGVWSLVGLGLAGAAIALPIYLQGELFLWSLLPAVALGGVMLLVWRSIVRQHFLPALVFAMAGAAVAFPMIIGTLLPSLKSLWVSQEIASAVDRYAPGKRLAAAGYHEPSLVFLCGTETLLQDAAGAAQSLIQGKAGAAAIEERELPAFLSMASRQPDIQEATTISGLNYSRGKPVVLHIFIKGKIPE